MSSKTAASKPTASAETHAEDPEHGSAHAPHAKIKPDDTPPQNAIILAAAILSVLSLFALKYVFDSYMDRSEVRVRAMHIEESHAAQALIDYRLHAALELNGGEMPMDYLDIPAFLRRQAD